MENEKPEREIMEAQLSALAKQLAVANSEYSQASDFRKKLEQEALDDVRKQHVNLYEREQTWKSNRERLEADARKLLDDYRLTTGETGNVLDGMYQITAPRKLQIVNGLEMEDLVSVIINQMPFLKRFLTVDMKALDKALNGSVPEIIGILPIQYLPEYGNKIMWSKLPDAEEIKPEELKPTTT